MNSGKFMSVARPRTLLFITVVVSLFVGVLTLYADGDTNKTPAAFRDRLYDVQFLSDREVFAVGYPGLLLHSMDAGKTWQRTTVGGNEPFFAIDFVGKLGWMVGRSGYIFHTDDGGATWHKQDSGLNESLFDVDFWDDKRGVVVGNFGTVLTTDDGGRTWTASVIEMMQSAAINGLLLTGPQTGFCAGEYPIWETELTEDIKVDQISNMWRTTDGGATWQRMETGVAKTLYSILFLDENVGFAAGNTGTLIKTYDGGVSWKQLTTPFENVFMNLTRINETIYVAGTEGVVLRVENEKITQLNTKLYSWLCGIGFGNAKDGVLVGGRGTVMYTKDGGTTWIKHPIK